MPGPATLSLQPLRKAQVGFVASVSATAQQDRTRALLAAHPEARRLVGHAPVSAAFVLLLVAVQTGLAIALANASGWAMLLCAYAFGAAVSLGLWVLIHECVHDLIFSRRAANAWLMLVANGPLLFPAATTFRKYHLMHHAFHADPARDGDLPSPIEVQWVGNCPVRKALWLLFMWAIQGLRTSRLEGARLIDRDFLVNCLTQSLYIAGLALVAGPQAFLYLFLCATFSMGLHPLGARWIQEHYLFRAGQGTSSYYGPANRLLFNAGYHVEHHDLMRVPWMRLPEIRAIAPEFYDHLYAHRSWTRLLFRFLLDREFTLCRRAIRTRPDRHD